MWMVYVGVYHAAYACNRRHRHVTRVDVGAASKKMPRACMYTWTTHYITLYYIPFHIYLPAKVKMLVIQFISKGLLD
jgi:hypothetical protein